MAPKTVSVTVKYSVPGTQPPIFLAGSFSDPAWQPQEMQYTTDENNEHEFFKEVNVEQGKEYQYKFRIGPGDWWILNENSPTATDNVGNRNNVLTVPITEDTVESKPTQDHQEETPTKMEDQSVHDKPLGGREAIPESIEEAMGTRETSDVLFSDEIVQDIEEPAVASFPMTRDPLEPLEPRPTPAAGLDKRDIEFGQGKVTKEDHTKVSESAEATKPAAVPSPEIGLKSSPPDTPMEPRNEYVEAMNEEDHKTLHAPTVVVEKVDDEPSYGDDFGPNATRAQKDAYSLRTQDAEPDQTIVQDTHKSEPADVAAEVADSAETLDRDAPTPPISDEEAGRIGYRRLSNTPIPEVAKTAAEVADTAAILDRKAIGDLLEERGYFAIMEDESIVFPETPADEKVPLFPHERGISPKGSKLRRGPVDIPRKPVKLDDPAAYDPNDPSIKPFPEDREGILRHLEQMQRRLPPDTADCVGGVNSPIKEEIHCPEKPISPGITFQDPSPSLDAITEDDEEQDLPNGGLMSLNREPTVQVNGVNGVKENTEKPKVEKENNAVPAVSSQGENGKIEPETGNGSHREIPALESHNISPLMNQSMDRLSFDGGDDDYVKVDPSSKNSADDAKPSAATIPSIDIPAVEVQSAESKLTNPIDRSASPDAPLAVSPTQLPATPLIVGNRQLGHEEEDVQKITTETGLSIQVQPATPRGSTADPDMGKSTAFEDKNGSTQIKARKKQASPTPDRPITPSSVQGKDHSKSFLKAIWKVVFVEWIGGFIMRLCNGGRGRQTLLAVTAFAVLASAPTIYRFFLTRLVEFKTRKAIP